MQREERLTGKRQFSTVQNEGKRWANELVVLLALPNRLEINRYGFSVSKRLGKAVVRNRVRRLLREAVRLTPTKKGWDMVFIARKGASSADYWSLRDAVHRALSRAKLLESAQPVGMEG